MATRTIKTVFQVRRDTTANWELYQDIVPAAGEPCYDLDLKTLRIGDGTSYYKDLPVIGGIENAEDLQAAVDKLQEQIGETNVTEIHENMTQLTTQVNNASTDIVTIQKTLETKADVETISELQTVIEQKVDTEAIDTMTTELKTYVDEKIKLVEVGNIDDGEI